MISTFTRPSPPIVCTLPYSGGDYLNGVAYVKLHIAGLLVPYNGGYVKANTDVVLKVNHMNVVTVDALDNVELRHESVTNGRVTPYWIGEADAMLYTISYPDLSPLNPTIREGIAGAIKLDQRVLQAAKDAAACVRENYAN